MSATTTTEELADLIRYHSDKYFNDEPEITDAEFDLLVKEMKEADPEHPVLAEVGATPSYGKKIAHETLMGSLDKITYDEGDEDSVKDLYEWARELIGKHGVIALAPKMDGLAGRIVYSDGDLVLAATRGDGYIGQDITDNVREIASVPNKIEYKGFVEVRGEFYMKQSIFNAFRDEMIDAGEKKIPKNPRNAASGILNQKDPKKTAKVPLHFKAYSVYSMDDFGDTEQNIMKNFKKLIPELEYVPIELVLVNPKDLLVAVHDWESSRVKLDYQIDGLVFSVNEIKLQEKYGYKGKCPVGKVAFKFRPEQETTTLLDITWQLGRTGKLTPVAQLEPVELAGTTIDSPTLHNYAQVKAKGICIGDELLIEKAGEIIPQVVRVVKEGEIKGEDRKHNSVINYPEVCPSCFEKTELDERKVSVWCVNPTCPGQAEHRMTHFLKTIEVDGVGPGIVNKLLTAGLVETLVDLFNLKVEDVAKLEGMGKASAKKVIDAINTRRRIPLALFLDSLGIHGLGTSTSKMIARELKTIEEVMEVSYVCFEEMEGIGEKTAKSIESGLEKLETMVEEIMAAGVEIVPVEEISGGLSGKSFCVTGTLSVGRKEMAAEIEAAGGIVKSSVSKGLDYLVAGDKTGKSKTDKAAKYGTEVISEATLREMMG